MGEYKDRAKMQDEAEARGLRLPDTTPQAQAPAPITQGSRRAGLRLPGRGQRYLMEAEDGTLVPVSGEKLTEWSEAQRNAGSGRLNRGEERLLDRALQLIYGKREEVKYQSARELGIQSGSETPDLKVFPQESYDEEMRDVANWAASEYGLPVTFVSGVIHVEDGSGNRYRVRGVYTGNGIILQADNRNESITSLARHELFHDEAARDAGLVEAIRDELVALYSPEEIRQILRGYIINLRGEVSVDENTDMMQLDEAAMRIFEEVCADAASGINAFGLGAYQYEKTVNRVRKERAALRGQASGERETRGPPTERYSDEDNGGTRISVQSGPSAAA